MPRDDRSCLGITKQQDLPNILPDSTDKTKSCRLTKILNALKAADKVRVRVCNKAIIFSQSN